jgi:hypothetical protein
MHRLSHSCSTFHKSFRVAIPVSVNTTRLRAPVLSPARSLPARQCSRSSRGPSTAAGVSLQDASTQEEQQQQLLDAPLAAAAASLAAAPQPARTTAAARAAAKHVLLSLGRYTPTGLSDGPASLSQVLPYNAAEVQHALQHGSYLLPRLSAHRLANIAAALAAAGHLDKAFMQRLGSHAAQRLRTAAAPQDSSKAALQMRAACFLAVAYARLGLIHEELLQQVALTGVVHSAVRVGLGGRMLGILACSCGATLLQDQAAADLVRLLHCMSLGYLPRMPVLPGTYSSTSS